MRCYRGWGAVLWLAVWLVVSMGGLWPPQAVAAPSAPALPLTGAAAVDTAGYLERLDDPEGILDPASAATSGGWTRLPGNLNASYTHSAIWLRLRLDVQGAPHGGWMLSLSNALIDDARVYVRHGDGWRLLSASGEDVPRDDWPVGYRSPAFEFSPAAAGPQELLVRLQSRNALTTRLEVWPRLDFDNHSRREGLFFGLYFGFYLLLICLQALFWLSTREPASGLFLIYLGGCVFNEAMGLGLIQQITGMPGAWSDPLQGMSISASLAVAVRMSGRQMALAQCLPRLARAANGLTGTVALAGAVLAASGHYAWAMIPVQLMSLLVIVSFSSVAGWLAWRGWWPARLFLLVFGVFYLGVMVGFLRNLGYLPVNVWTQNASALGTMVHMVLLSLWIVGGYERRRRAREREQDRHAVELERQHSQALETEVSNRTAELSAEIARREQLEIELRNALAQERRVHAEQRDFVAMVSHEFRTPLAIINTSAQQLARNLGAPSDKSLARCGNIRAAALRLLALVDDYLTDDRMREPRPDLRLESCDLRALLAELIRDFAPGRIAYEVEPDVAHGLVTDTGLLRIALRNLLANADRHAPHGTQVAVRVRSRPDGLFIEVANEGDAIAVDERERLFQKYYRGRNAQGQPGAGLGLYLVRRIAERLGGWVVLAEDGRDGRVCFRLDMPH